MADHGDVTTTQAEIEWEGVLWEVDIETEEGGPFLRLSLWRTKANYSREQVQAEDPPEDPLTVEKVQAWLLVSEVPQRIVHALAQRVVEARSAH
jgi:hypothetical protein